MGEKYLMWGEELQEKLYARVASEELNITEEQLVPTRLLVTGPAYCFRFLTSFLTLNVKA